MSDNSLPLDPLEDISSYETEPLGVAFSLDTQRETQLKNREWELNNEEKEDNLKYRKGLVLWTTILTSVFLIFVLIFLVLYASKNDFKFSEKIMITLLATTTATILGLPAIVLRGLFKIKDTTR